MKLFIFLEHKSIKDMFSLIYRKILGMASELEKMRKDQERIMSKMALMTLGDEIAGGRQNRENMTVDVSTDLPISTPEMLISVESKLDDDEAYRREMVNLNFINYILY